MSSKQTSKKHNVDKLDPRIAPKEMIITRHKSALQKRQLRNKDRSMKTITKLLKGPTKPQPVPTIKASQKKVNIVKSPQKKLEKTENLEIEDKEFYPNTLKRNVIAKKILLKPKYNMKVIAGTNKRKMCTPHRGIKTPPPFCRPRSSQSNHSELSMADVIRMAEETHSLDDEDLMEILTCPSPVWWEDPPDCDYDEDAIFMNGLQESEDKNEKEPLNNDDMKQSDKLTDKEVSNNNIVERSKQFSQKRSKLENLLGTIKSKILGCDTKLPITNIKPIISPKTDIDKHNISESTEEEMFSDISMNEEEVLNDLESIDIPVESTVKIDSETTDNKEEVKDIPKNMPQLKRCPAIINESPKNSSEETHSSDFDSISDTNVRFIEEIDGKTDTNSNTKVRSRKKAKAKKVETPKEENTVTVSQSVDKEIVSDLGLNTNDIEYITVYKIMSNRNDSPKKDCEIEQPKEKAIKRKRNQNHDIKRKLNLFFKKCKDNRRNGKRKIQNDKKSKNAVKEIDKDSILVSQNDKYCYKCSSIFDTDECSYCKRKSKVEKAVEKAVEKPVEKPTLEEKQCMCLDNNCLCDKSESFTCNLCDFKTNVKNDYVKHTLVHNTDSVIKKSVSDDISV